MKGIAKVVIVILLKHTKKGSYLKLFLKRYGMASEVNAVKEAAPTNSIV